MISSRLLDLLVGTRDVGPDLPGYSEDSDDGPWALQAAIDQAVPMPIASTTPFAHFASRRQDVPAMKVVAALCNGASGHAVTAAGSVERVADAPGAQIAPPAITHQRNGTSGTDPAVPRAG